jgi:hypothetical protein
MNSLGIQDMYIFRITRGAYYQLHQAAVMEALDAHFDGDWGDIPNHVAEKNDVAMQFGGRIVSHHHDEEVTFVIESSTADNVPLVRLL